MLLLAEKQLYYIGSFFKTSFKTLGIPLREVVCGVILPERHCWSHQNGGPYFDILQKILLLSILQFL